jgi:hypothetical protein
LAGSVAPTPGTSGPTRSAATIQSVRKEILYFFNELRFCFRFVNLFLP